MPKGELRIGANPTPTVVRSATTSKLPNPKDYEVKSGPVRPTAGVSRGHPSLAFFTRDIIKKNPRDFGIFGPDDTTFNRLQASYEVTNKQWDTADISDEVDEHMHVARSSSSCPSTRWKASSRLTC